jgi:pimeloyl-ACP methyl ester carboxylesterase
MILRMLGIAFASLILIIAAALWFTTARISAQIERDFPPVGSFFSLRDGKLHLVDRPASGATRGTVLLLHGASSNHADLLAQLGPGLAQYRVIAPDRPGLGWSDRIGGNAAASPVFQAALMAELLDQQKTGPVIIVAHSLAGVMALNMALERPDLVRGLVLLAPVAMPWPGGIAWYYHPSSWPLIGPVFTRLVAVPAGSLMLDQGASSVFAPDPVTPGYSIAGKIPLILRPDSFHHNAQDVAALHAQVVAQSGRYREIRAPLVAFHGMLDTVTSAIIHTRALVDKVPGAVFVPLPTAGHMPHHVAKAEVIRAIDEMASSPVFAGR